MPGPLQGLKVIELSHIMAGPVCGMMLADMGAEVIKVEKINGGDDSRKMVPPEVAGESAAFMMMNRNKRGVALDLKDEDGRAALARMLGTADMVIENYRHDTMEKLGLGYDRLKAENPGLIYVEISGYGRTGPYAERAGFDLIAQGVSGLMSITGSDGEGPPVKVGAPVTDITAGIIAAMGALGAYIHRLKTGQGQRVDTSLFEAGITHTFWQSAIFLATGISPRAMGSAHPLNAPYQAFATEDGWINIGAANQKNWEILLGILKAEHLRQDPRFADNASRMTNREQLVKALTPLLKARKTRDWLDLMDAAGLPAGPILSVGEMLNHAQTLARGMVVVTDHSIAGSTKALGHPVHYHATPARVTRPAPILGQHTDEVLAEYGFDAEAITSLREKGVIL
ncbi:CaiB/BaiF CoA transferase family protein [Alphaproteobacteria bacterium LSUCC0684]